jgi:hypothetical protein
MEYTTGSCRSPPCPMYGQVASSAHVKRHDWQRQGLRVRCERCGGIVSATTGTAYVGDTHRPHHRPARRDGAGSRVQYPMRCLVDCQTSVTCNTPGRLF